MTTPLSAHRFEGKVALITGGGGQGQVAAACFAEEGTVSSRAPLRRSALIQVSANRSSSPRS